MIPVLFGGPSEYTMNLLKYGSHRLSSGLISSFKIECDDISSSDWWNAALIMGQAIPAFGRVESVISGGDKWASYWHSLAVQGNPNLLIVDDVLTTGASMEKQRHGRPALGVVMFARGPVPDWVTPMFSIYPGLWGL